MTICLPTTETISRATDTLIGGGVVSFATETVYGLGCDTFNVDAIAKVYELKKRPINNPMIAHILDVSWANQLCTGWNDKNNQLAERFWPGPLTIVLPKKEAVPISACGGHDTIAIRCPSHPVARMLLSGFNKPISAPSANLSGHISPTTAQHVEDEFGVDVMVIDGGACEKGIESTVISMVGYPTILRPGSISKEEIESVIGSVETNNSQGQSDSPGTSPRHYAPNTKVVLVNQNYVSSLNDHNCVVVSVSSTPIAAKKVFKMPIAAEDYARKLYSTLREADSVGANKIVIEKPYNTPEWRAINDRLDRCCAR